MRPHNLEKSSFLPLLKKFHCRHFEVACGFSEKFSDRLNRPARFDGKSGRDLTLNP